VSWSQASILMWTQG